MKTFLQGGFSVIAALLSVTLIGFLQVRIEAQQLGAVIDMDSNVIGVSAASAPLLQILGIAVVCAVVIYLLLRSMRRATKTADLLPALLFSLTVIAVSIWFIFAADYPYVGEIRSVSPYEVDGSTGAALDPAFVQWLRAGALNSATHALAAILLVLGFTAHSQTGRIPLGQVSEGQVSDGQTSDGQASRDHTLEG